MATNPDKSVFAIVSKGMLPPFRYALLNVLKIMSELVAVSRNVRSRSLVQPSMGGAVNCLTQLQHIKLAICQSWNTGVLYQLAEVHSEAKNPTRKSALTKDKDALSLQNHNKHKAT